MMGLLSLEPAPVQAVGATAPERSSLPPLTPGRALRLHWPEYLMEAEGLGFFMASACLFGTLYENPASQVRQAISSTLLRRLLMGLSMGLTSIAIVYSPWGKQSGAHINPSVTLTFLRLGTISKWDALFYIMAQFVGAVLRVMFVALFFGVAISNPAVRYVVTIPGETGTGVALVAGFVISFLLMSVVLLMSNHYLLSRFTAFFPRPLF